MSLRAAIYAVSPAFLHAPLRRIEASDIGSRLARGMFWTLAGTLVSRGLTLLALILVARMLGTVGFGELGVITSSVTMIGIFAGFGLGLTASKHVAQYRASDPERAGRILSLSACVAAATGGIMAGALWLSAPFLAEHTLNAPHLAGYLEIAAILVALNAINGAQTGALTGFEAFKTVAKVNLAVGLLSFPMLLIGTYWGGLTGAAWALVLNQVVSWFLHNIAVRAEARRFAVPLSFRGVRQELPVLWTFSLPAMLASAMVGPVNWACLAMLVNQPNGYAEAGIFNAANQWYVMLLYLPGVMSTALLPLLSSTIGDRPTEGTRKALLWAVLVNVAVALPITLAVCLFSGPIMSLYGEGFADAAMVLAVTVITALLVSSQTPVGQIIAASGMMWIGFATNLAWACVFIGSFYALIDHGALGLVLARLIGYIAHATWTFGFAWWYLTRSEINPVD